MKGHFYMWLFFSITVIVIVTVWIVVFSKTIKYSLAGDGTVKMPAASEQFKEAELKLKNFQSTNKALLDTKSKELKEKILQEAALKKMKEKLENINGVRTTN